MESPKLFLLFNHRITELQKRDAEASLGIGKIVEMPPEIQSIWSKIPPEQPEISPILDPVKAWIQCRASPGDYILIQGDFGACWIMVAYAFEMGLIPIYSTTSREAKEEHHADGSVALSHRFKHCIFRRYGV